MESLLNFICEHAHHAPLGIFCLLLLTGFNIPISEDLLIISGGILVSSCIPDHMFRMWLWVYAGACLSAWEAYWIGRYFGPKLYEMRWFHQIITEKRVARLKHYYEKFGIFIFIFIRFLPGGIRNGFSMSCGLTKFSFPKFILFDELAALISVNVLFFLGYTFGQNSELLFHYIKRYDEWAMAIIVIAIITVVMIIRYKKKTHELK